MPLQLVIVDDHKIVRDAIKAILAQNPVYQIAAEVETGTDVVSVCRRATPDLVLMDVSLPGMNGFEATVELLRHCSGVKVAIISMYDDRASVLQAVRCGALGYILKSASATELLEAVHVIASGGSYFSPRVTNHVFDLIQHGALENHTVARLASLTRREMQVLRLIASGKGNKEIAILLNLELETIRTYRKHLMQKLGVTNVADLTRVAISAGATVLLESGGRPDPPGRPRCEP